MTSALQDSLADLYWYRARLVRVVDGDTVDLDVDLGFLTRRTMRFRLLGIDAPEIRGEQRPRGLRARTRLIELIRELSISPNGAEVLVRSHSDRTGKFGRWLAELFGADASGALVSLNERLIAEGHATRIP